MSEMFLIVSNWGVGGTPGIMSGVKPGDAAEHHAIHRVALVTERSKIAIMPTLKPIMYLRDSESLASLGIFWVSCSKL